ncbi:NACHT domain-containing protein [Kineosporia babensis]|uniref:NACHT domain-containing protein n=1 Tax=Kineosporia babensis TaxID=499548 RepID=A0A9X1NEH3_9ACTN|nr:NACHT domain-containing protein [Kineosporia babensis]MCD5312330.1 NACHT domain-containing protein [Kineosporia babensis]
MLTDAVVWRIAGGVVGAALKSAPVKNTALRAVGREPLQLAVKNSLAKALEVLQERHPGWTGSLFDASFLEHEAAPLIARVITRGQQVVPADLARSYVRSLSSSGERLPLVREVEPAATTFLEAFTAAITSESAAGPVLDARAIDELRTDLAAVRAALGAGAATEATTWDYLDWAIDRNLHLDPRGTFQTQRQVKLRLEEIFVSLDAAVLNELNGPDTEHDEPSASESSGSRVVLGWKTVLGAHPQVVVLGDPGAGKTTLLRHLALANARALADPDAPREDLPEGRVRLPVLIRIGDYAQDETWRRSSLTDFLEKFHDLADCPADALGDLFTQRLANGDVLILLDGLDEITTVTDRTGVVKRVEEFVRRHAGAGNRFVITSRVAGYREVPLTGDFVHFRARDMDREQIEGFLRRWCLAVEQAQAPHASAELHRGAAGAEVSAILAAVDHAPGVARLAVNPLMLRILALIHSTGAQLPQKRIELYRLAADTLARTWRTAQGVPASALAEERHVTRLLGDLAYWIHSNRPDGMARHDEILQVLGPRWAKINGQPWDEEDPSPTVLSEVEKFLATVRVHTGLFVERAPGRYGFLHLTFQEYYAARYLVALPRRRIGLIRAQLHDPRWQEPILLALGFTGLSSAEASNDLVAAAVLALGDEDEEPAPTPHEELLGRDFLFALRCLADEIPVDRPLAEKLLGQAAEELMHCQGRAQYSGYRASVLAVLSSMQSASYREVLAGRFLQAVPGGSEQRCRWIGAAAVVAAEPRMLEQLLEFSVGADRQVQFHAAGALATWVPEIESRILDLSRDESVDLGVRARLVAAWAEAGMPGLQVEERLVQFSLDPGLDPLGRAQVLLGLEVTAETVGQLLELGKDPKLTSAEELMVLTSLAQEAGDPRVGDRLLVLSRDETQDLSLRDAAIGALGRASSSPETTEYLLELISAPELEPLLRSRAVKALNRADGRQQVNDRLLAWAADEAQPAVVRSSAVAALGERPLTDEVTQVLLPLACDTQQGSALRAAVLTALGWADRRTPGLAEWLLKVGSDPETELALRRPALVAWIQLAGWDLASRLIGDLDPGRTDCLIGSLSCCLQSSERILGVRARPAVQLLFYLRLRQPVVDFVPLVNLMLTPHLGARGAVVDELVKVGASPVHHVQVCELLLAALDDTRFGEIGRPHGRPARDYAYDALRRLLADEV